MDGPEAGKLVYFDPGHSVVAGEAARNGRPRGENGKVIPMTLAERRDRLHKRRAAHAVKKVEMFLRDLTPERTGEIVSPWTQRRNNRAKGAVVFDATALLVAFGTTHRADYIDDGEAWKRYDSLRASEAGQQAAVALLVVAEVWAKRLAMQTNHHAPAQAEDARRMCEILGLDFAAIEGEAVREIPEPKSWAGLHDDGPPTQLAETTSDDAAQEASDDKSDTTPPWVAGDVAAQVG